MVVLFLKLAISGTGISFAKPSCKEGRLNWSLTNPCIGGLGYD